MIRSILAILLLAALPFSPAAAQQFDPRADFEAFWTLFADHYALFEEKEVDWQLIGEIYRPRVTPQTTRAELFSIFEAAIDNLNDVHVTVRDEREGRFARSGGRSIGTDPFDVGIFDIELIERSYLTGPMTVGGGGTMRWGWIGEFGYLHVAAFNYPTTSAAAADEVIATFASGAAIIVDVRQNSGGSDAVARNLVARFADIERLVMTAARRIPGAEFGAPENWHVGPGDKVPFDKPVLVLVNDRTISAAENFAIMMRAFPHVTIVGATTAGALADTYIHRIGDGWTIGVPGNVLLDAEGRSWEGIGVVPHLWASNSVDRVASGEDHALDLAVSVAMVAAQ